MGTPRSSIRFHISEPDISDAEVNAVARTLLAGELTMSGGHAVAGFEAALAEYLGVHPARVVSCSSGTAALHLALLALDLPPGARIAVPSLTYVATVAALRYIGAVPVFVDVDDTWTMDPAQLAYEHKTDPNGGLHAVLPVHLYGMPANLEALDGIGIPIIEDAAQALGASYQGRKVGDLEYGLAATFSFYANKLITTGGEGGAVVFSDQEFARRARLYRGQGQSVERRYWHEVVGYNYRMTAMQAAFGTAQLRRLKSMIERRVAVFDAYADAFESQQELVWQKPTVFTDVQAPWLFTVLLPSDCDRNAVATYLASVHGIETRPTFPPVHLMPPYQEFAAYQSLNKTIDISNRGLSLPTHSKLDPRDASYIAESVIAAIEDPFTLKHAERS